MLPLILFALGVGCAHGAAVCSPEDVFGHPSVSTLVGNQSTEWCFFTGSRCHGNDPTGCSTELERRRSEPCDHDAYFGPATCTVALPGACTGNCFTAVTINAAAPSSAKRAAACAWTVAIVLFNAL